MKRTRKRDRRIDGRKFCREMLMVGRHWKVEEFFFFFFFGVNLGSLTAGFFLP